MKRILSLVVILVVCFTAPVFAEDSLSMTDWRGFYGGVALSASDADYTSRSGSSFPRDRNGNMDGYGYGALLGWNGQRGHIVYGAEVSLKKTDNEGCEDCQNPTWACGAEVEGIASLRGRVGWTGAKTLIYGTAGFAGAKMSGYTQIKSNGRKYSDEQTLPGWVAGFGLEQQLHPRVRLRAAVLRYDFHNKDFQFDSLYRDVTADFITAEVALIFNF